MKLSKLQAVTPEVVEFVNEKMAEGQGIQDTLLVEFGQKKVTKRVADKAQSIEKMIEELGYILSDGIYKLEEKEFEIVEETKEESQQKSEVKNKKTYVTKKQKQKEIEEKLKENPFALVNNWDLLEVVDQVACDIAKGEVKQVGVYTNSYVDEAFKTLQDRFYYIPAYLLINASVHFTERNLENFINSNCVEEFTKIYQNDKLIRKLKSDSSKELREEKKEISKKIEENSNDKLLVTELKERLKKINSELRRKQTNVKMSTHIADTTMFFLKEKFPFLSQSDIILMCIYSFSKCFINESNKTNDDLKNN